jgi:hypothetical protein
MSKERFSELVMQLKAQYLPNGNIELLEGSEVDKHPLMSELPFLESITEMRMENGADHCVLKRLTDKFFLIVSANKNDINLGMLLIATKHISKEIRDSSIIIA